MKNYNIILQSKNQTSLYNFINFLNKYIYLNFNVLKKSSSKKKRKKVFTILKSPHVNKKAQEQFEIKTYSKQLQINSTQAASFLVFLKKIKTYIYTDINIKLKVTKENKQFTKKIFNPDNLKKNVDYLIYPKNIKLNRYKKYKIKSYQEQKRSNINQNFLKSFDLYGKN